MASPTAQRIADSVPFKFLQPAVSTLLAAAVLSVGGRILDRMDRMEQQLGAMQRDSATMEIRLSSLEKLVPERAAAIKALQDKTLVLELKVDDLQRSTPPRARQ